MNKSIHVLIVEDSKLWANLLVRQLETEGYEVDYDVVSSEKEFRDTFDQKNYDLVLSDYNLPDWSAEAAYALVQSSGKNIPFIVVTGAVGEEKAVELLKMGVQDMILKQNIFRLPLAVKTAIVNKELHENQRKFQEKLEQSELRFRGILEQSEFAILGYDGDGTILFSNERCKYIFNALFENAMGKNLISLSPTMEQERVRERVRKIFNSESVPDEDWSITDSDNKKRHFHTTHYGVKDNSGKVILGVSATLDVTERMCLEEQLIQAQKMESLGQLTGGIAHDFNNQLTVILCNLNFALKGLDKNHPIYSLLVDMNKSAEHCALTVKELLTFGHKTEKIQKTTLDFHTILEDYEKFICHLLPSNIKMEIKKSADRCLVEGDATRIQQVLMNLSVNARDAMPEGGDLFLETKNVYFDENYAKKIPEAHPGQFFCVSVTDTGCGIPPEILPKIFEPFFTTKKPGKGTGLGLSSAYGIVKELGGWISVYSDVGRGTTFKVYLPISLGSMKADPAEEYRKIRGGNETILIADDEDAIRNLAKTVLERKGYHIILAKDGEEAIASCKDLSWLIDLVLLDLTMPRFSVDEGLKHILSVHPHARVVISSGYSLTGETAQQLLSQGAIAFVQKPYQPDELAGIVRRVLDLRIRPETANKEAA
ncbi:MAG: response regulator [Candidatus Omnitrophica bacterium]|nr:response regulator [Candidatus Omnitrophota bacterium]